MKHLSVLFGLALLLAACSSDNEEKTVLNGSAVETSVLLTFSPYEVDAMTRTATSINPETSKLFPIFFHDGTKTKGRRP